MPKSLIVAMDRQGIIGRDGDLPWRLSRDLKRFRSLTMGHCLVMGRTTFESIGRALPGRTSIVLSRSATWAPPANVLRAASLDEAWRLCGDDSEPFVIGGGQIYRLALPDVTRIYCTWVEAEVAGDARFPELAPENWRSTRQESFPASDRDDYPTRFEILDRITEA